MCAMLVQAQLPGPVQIAWREALRSCCRRGHRSDTSRQAHVQVHGRWVQVKGCPLAPKPEAWLQQSLGRPHLQHGGNAAVVCAAQEQRAVSIPQPDASQAGCGSLGVCAGVQAWRGPEAHLPAPHTGSGQAGVFLHALSVQSLKG